MKFSEQELLEVVEATKKFTNLLEDDERKFLMINSLTVQALKLKFLLLMSSNKVTSKEMVGGFLKECLAYLTTFHFACKNLTDKLPEYTDLRLFLKMLCVVYSQLLENE